MKIEVGSDWKTFHQVIRLVVDAYKHPHKDATIDFRFLPVLQSLNSMGKGSSSPIVAYSKGNGGFHIRTRDDGILKGFWDVVFALSQEKKEVEIDDSLLPVLTLMSEKSSEEFPFRVG